METMLKSGPKCDCGGESDWEHPDPDMAIGVARCRKCGWIVASYNCPWIPVYVKEQPNEQD